MVDFAYSTLIFCAVISSVFCSPGSTPLNVATAEESINAVVKVKWYGEFYSYKTVINLNTSANSIHAVMTENPKFLMDADPTNEFKLMAAISFQDKADNSQNNFFIENDETIATGIKKMNDKKTNIKNWQDITIVLSYPVNIMVHFSIKNEKVFLPAHLTLKSTPNSIYAKLSQDEHFQMDVNPVESKRQLTLTFDKEDSTETTVSNDTQVGANIYFNINIYFHDKSLSDKHNMKD